MSLRANSLFQSDRRKFFMNSLQNICKNLESKFVWAQEAEMSLTAISSLESARTKFLINSTHNMCKNLESNVFGLRRPK